MNANLELLGNFPGYKHEPRMVVSESPLDLGNPMMFLKFYNMFKRGEFPVMKRNIDLAKGFIKTEAQPGRINALSGLGFVIMSSGFLNVARWSKDKDAPYLLKNQVYEWEPKDGGNILTKKVDIAEDGAFCAFELGGGVAYETKAWLKYLKSKRTIQDKMKYIDNSFVGEV